MISGFRREIDENCALQGNYTASSGNLFQYIYISNKMQLYSLLYLETALHVSDVTSTHHQERMQLSLQHAVGRVVCAPDDGWWYHPNHVEQFPDIINGVKLHLVGYILEYICDARTYERQNLW
jgi:hypothetical protein